MGFRSGGAQASPGRSLREYEEQMTALRKENFNLKLRIYFLEEKNSGGAADTDTVLKQNVDLKVSDIWDHQSSVQNEFIVIVC
jgi:Centrosomin N-terminal motif 1